MVSGKIIVFNLPDIGNMTDCTILLDKSISLNLTQFVKDKVLGNSTLRKDNFSKTG
jgi:hypothetical protein